MSGIRRKNTVATEPIELFSTHGGIRAVDSPVRVKILEMLRDGELPFDTIVARAGKAKSTVSVHLNDMSAEGIIGSRLDSRDRRKKVFFINASYLGGLARERLLEDNVQGFVNGEPGIADLFKFIFRAIRVEMYLQGINIDPVLSDAGHKVGAAVYASIGSPELDDTLVSLAEFWSSHQLGRIEFESRDPLVILVYDCFECSDLPQLGRTACAFDLGLFQGIFSAYFGGGCGVRETECYAIGSGRCRFVVEG